MKSPYLSVFTNRRVAATLLLSISSGLPLPLVSGTLDVWMKSANVDLTVIGVFSLVQLPYSLKMFWAPLMDRFSLPFLHRRAGWMLLTQILLVAAIFVMGGTDPITGMAWVAALALVVSFLSASQDIAIDGYRAEVLKDEERGAGAAMASVGGRVGYLISGSLALILSEHLSWQEVYWVMAGGMGIGILGTLISPAPANDKEVIPPTIGKAVREPFQHFLKREHAVGLLVFILLYKLGDVVAGKMTSPFLLEVGFSRGQLGIVNKGFGMIISILGGIAGGAFYAKWGLVKSLWVFGILQAVSNFVFVAQYFMGPQEWMLFATIGVENLCASLGTVAFVALLMSLCDKGMAGTQYALLSSIMALTRTVAATPTGFMAKAMGWPLFFSVSAFLAIPGMLLLYRFRKELEPKVAVSPF